MEPIARHALNAVDAVHTVLDVPAVSVFYTYDIDRFGAYVPEQDSSARRFELSYYGPYPGLTLTHEVGHFLDHALGEFDVYLSSEPVSAFSRVMQQLESSLAVLSLRHTLASRTDLPQMQRFQLLYWLSPQEQWARAYAQFIAAHSGDAKLTQAIEQARDARGIEVFRNVHWGAADFAAIDAEISTAFMKLGWMR